MFMIIIVVGVHEDPFMVYLPTISHKKSTIHVGKYMVYGSDGIWMPIVVKGWDPWDPWAIDAMAAVS